MFEFAHTEDLWLLLIIPILVIVFIAIRINKTKAIRKFGEPELVASLMPGYSAGRPVFKFMLFLMSLTFIILAYAGPRFGSRLEEVKREGVEIIIALDVSSSMLASDISPSRLERSKMAVTRLIGNLRNDRVGLIVFAGEAYVQVPITSDYAAARMILESISTDIVPVQGTAIGRAIELASRSFTPDSPAGRVLIIISDGEDHEDDPVRVAELAGENDIIVHTIGMGRPEGAPVPLPGGGQTRFMTDAEGNTVISRLDEATLRRIASAGDGIFVRAGSSGTGLDIIMEEIDEMEKAELDELVYTEFEERFQYVAAVALLLLMIDFLVNERKNRWLNSINLFK